MIILLNGTSSSGKTMLLNLIAETSDLLFLKMGIDTIWGSFLPTKYIMFNEKSDLGFKLIKTHKGIETKTGIYGEKISKIFIENVKNYSDNGFNIIMDDVILNKHDLSKYNILKNDDFFFIGVYCEKEECLKRELIRQDRPIGLVEGQFDLIHQFSHLYDLSIDNTKNYQQNVIKILDFITLNKARIKSFIP